MLSIICTTIVFFSCSTNNNNGTITVAPLAPTSLTCTVISNNQVNLSWIDNATNEDGYKIERKTGGGNFTVVGSAGANISNFSDLGLTANTTYTYRVYAYNSAGSSLQYSNEVNVITQDPPPSWLTYGLIGYWPFNGNANDTSGNQNNGMAIGATLSTDRFGNSNMAFSFDGASFIQIPNDSILNFGITDYTLSAWVMKVGNDQYQSIISKRSYSSIGSTTSSTGWALNFVQNYPRFQSGYYYVNGYWVSNGDINYGSTLSNPISNNNWHHLVAVFNPSNVVLRLFIDGLLVETKTTSSNLNNSDNTSDLFFGVYQPGGAPGIPSGAEFFTGKLDDIRIYNRALSATEVTYLATH